MLVKDMGSYYLSECNSVVFSMFKLGGSPYEEFSNFTADMLEQKLS